MRITRREISWLGGAWNKERPSSSSSLARSRARKARIGVQRAGKRVAVILITALKQGTLIYRTVDFISFLGPLSFVSRSLSRRALFILYRHHPLLCGRERERDGIY